MKKLLIFYVLLFGSTLLLASDITLAISKATVYEEGVTIIRTGPVDIKSGEQIIRITDLPTSLDEQSLDIWLSGEAIILSQKFELSFTEEIQNTTDIELEKDLLEDSLAFLNILKAIKIDEKEIIKKNVNPTDYERSYGYDEISEIRKKYGKEMLEIEHQIILINKKIKSVNQSIILINEQIKRKGNLSQKRTGDLVLKLSSEKTYTANAELSYFHLDAGWSPGYDLRVNTLSAPLQIDYKAEVYQNTGEDWDNIQLSISTAQPTRNYNLPTLSTYLLSFNNYYDHARLGRSQSLTKSYIRGTVLDDYGEPLIGASVLILGTNTGTVTDLDGSFIIRTNQEDPRLEISYAGYASKEIAAYDGNMLINLGEDELLLDEVVVTGLGSTLSGYTRGVAKKKRVRESVPISLIRSTASYHYDITGKVTLNSTQEAETIFIRSEEVETNYVYQAFPKLEDQAYLTAEIDSWSELQILPGSANIYIDNRYVGATLIDDEYRKDGLRVISLGQDRSVNVRRRLATDFKQRRIIGKNVVEKRKWEILVENQRSESIIINIKDQYPISKDSDIKVDLKDYSNGDRDEDIGLITWNRSIESSASLELALVYEVKAPKDRHLIVD